MKFSPPPLDGSLSLPEIYDYHRQHNPNHPLFIYDDQGVIQTVTWLKAAQAADTAAQYILRFCPSGDKSTVIGILANIDTFTYFALIVGIIRAGYQVFPISPRNSSAGVTHLLQSTKATALLVSHNPGVQRLVAGVTANPNPNTNYAGPDIIPTPTFEYLFSSSEEDFERLPPFRHPDDNDGCMILHSSGTTAFPKPVVLSHRNVSNFGVAFYARKLCGEAYACHSLPMFRHIIFSSLKQQACTGLIVASFPPESTPLVASSDGILAAAVATKCKWIFCVPSYIETWARDPQSIVALKTFDGVMYAGGPLHEETGDQLASEGQDCPTHSPHVLNTSYGRTKAYDTMDLVARHPDNPDLWRIYGRCDEQLMHSTGEKTNPVPIETMLVRHPKIEYAVMFGRGRFHTGVLVQPTQQDMIDSRDHVQLARFRNEIWPLVEQINDHSPTHSRTFKEMILVADISKPFELTSKGVPMRAAVTAAYELEIEAAYLAVEQSSQTAIQPPQVWELDECVRFVRDAVGQVLSVSLENDDDMFQAGCDSLHATWIRNTILHALRHSAKVSTRNIPINFVYSHPTIHQLAIYIMQIVQCGQSSVALMFSSKRISEMGEMVEQFSTDFPRHSPGDLTHGGGDIVFLIGSTGFFGPHLLEVLVRDPTIALVYTLNRKDSKGDRSQRERHDAAFQAQGLNPSTLHSKELVMLEGTTDEERFGLSEELYRQLQSQVTCIIQNAWRVDFNVSLSSLQPLIAGTRRLIDFALGSPQRKPPRLLYVSTLGIFMNWTGTIIPEEPCTRPTSAVGLGYTESKWVAEQILQKAWEQTPLRPIIVRVGHLCGGHSGNWDTQEWVPILVRSAQVLNCLPSFDGEVSWIPVHIAASAVVEMRKSKDLFLNLAHPRPAAARDIFSALSCALAVPLVTFSEWLSRLDASRQEDSNNAVAAAIENPALVLFDFFRSMQRPVQMAGLDKEAFGFPSPASDKALAAAPLSLRTAPQLSELDVASWIRYWRQMGFLRSK
ncbi:hypothetical protein B0H34DRAFT_783775 [Crassisporium funariophilum]|nr:hypothetical protein B0H34DRAFT_783775 [Crassisporium funariophilum]